VATNKTYTVTLEEDPDTGELVLPIPTELLGQVGWDFGDTLVWDEVTNGTFSLSKKEVDKPDKEC